MAGKRRKNYGSPTGRTLAVGATVALGMLGGAAPSFAQTHTHGSHGSAGPTTPDRHQTPDRDTAPSEGQDFRFNKQDVSFLRDMIVHHQQALEMADLAEEYAVTPDVRDLADDIRRAQRSEIAGMKAQLRAWGQGEGSNSGHGSGHDGMPGMMSPKQMAELAQARGRDFDHLWLHRMIDHHLGALKMASAEDQEGRSPAVRHFALHVKRDQAREIYHMVWLTSYFD